ncbi:16185_t:CDS:2 [Funneliformis geosporum]|uniref:16185_t:CDS:1 n=1 Tax=Funneliformis geosporum TaxID=1117311 RepID=A0A9W4SIB5_9GLOM|nr:16185_t:CDS:2 [Funneliformis geosporum]
MKQTEMINSTDNFSIQIDKLFKLLIHMQDDDKDFDEIKHLINRCISLSDRSVNDIYDWLKESQKELKNIFILGIFSYYNLLGLKDNDDEGFIYFVKSAETFPIAQIYLDKCYNKIFGTEINYNLPFIGII